MTESRPTHPSCSYYGTCYNWNMHVLYQNEKVADKVGNSSALFIIQFSPSIKKTTQKVQCVFPSFPAGRSQHYDKKDMLSHAKIVEHHRHFATYHQGIEFS
jgi:hypothetical protein